MSNSLSEINPDSKPLAIFAEWMALAQATPGIREATAMTLTTQAADRQLHSRVVLCKRWSEDGFVFYTNYDSRKGADIDNDSRVALGFYFDPLFMQIKISGIAEKTSRAESEDYWNSRPRASQLSQFISRQSAPVKSREDLERAWSEADRQFHGQPIPCPAHWGGYLVRPRSIEFWIGRANRLHDTFHFEKTAAGWTFSRLAP